MKLPTSASNISIGWSPCGTFMAVGNKSDLVTVFDLRTGTVLRKKKFNYEVCTSFNPFTFKRVTYNSKLHPFLIAESLFECR